jgi:alpha-L-fucosidase
MPGAMMFSDGGPDVRWVGNEHGVAGDPCWATLNGKDFFPGEADQKRLNSGDRPGTDWIPAECDVSIRPGWFYHANEDAKVKTLEQLLDLYFKSVGRGASFLLNLPPDRRGRIADADVQSLNEFRKRLDAIFSKNLAAGAKVTASNVRGNSKTFAAKNVLSGNGKKYWSTDDNATTPELILDLGKPKTFNIVSLREFLPLGQRIEACALDQWKDGQWVQFAAGTSIGSRRLIRGDFVTTSKVRLRITQSPVCPALAEIGLFAEPSPKAASPAESGLSWPKADPAAVAHWQALRFGMFIHWGPVSLTGHEIGWSRGAETPVDVYDNLYHQFNPTNFNADEWVSIAKATGMKYIVLTTKHHDGFCLWDTKFTDYNIMHTPFHRDVVKELAAACKKQRIEFGAYYSVPDWYDTNWPVTSPAGTVKREKCDLDVYEKYLQNQITELIKNYGPLITIWNDMPAPYGKRGADTIKLVRRLQPNILINNRTGDGGDYDTPEQRIGKFQMDRPWESCMTVSAHNHWAWGGADDGVKSTAACLDMLIRGPGGDGNILLNVGPRPDGVIDPEQAARLKEIGAWLAKNGESIYGTRGGPWEPTPALASTRKDNRIYVHVLNWGEDPVRLPNIPAKIVSAKLLNGGKAEMHQAATEIEISVAPANRDARDTVVVLKLDSAALKIPAVAVPQLPAESSK